MSAQLFQNPRPDFERDLLTQLAARWGRRAVTLGVLGYLTPGQPGSPPRQDPVIEAPQATLPPTAARPDNALPLARLAAT